MFGITNTNTQEEVPIKITILPSATAGPTLDTVDITAPDEENPSISVHADTSPGDLEVQEILAASELSFAEVCSWNAVLFFLCS